ncbi:MAG: serine/threonine protein kinase [Sandaracinus sp.]|nr:serine/threonine protein kinase [Sandaracinus sp.]
MTLSDGVVLDDRYRVDALLGAGGMGRVYRGVDLVLDREVAIKTLSPELVRSAEGVARFRREALASSRLAHPNVVATFDLALEGATPYLVMELVDGPSLSDLLDHGRFSIDDALTVARELASALEAVHRRGILHRDLKPANVLIGRDGRARLADFGLARLPEHAELTRAGSFLGTPEYMAPERFRGAPPDATVDVYALGCVLHEMLLGRTPVTGDHPLAIATAALQGVKLELDGLPGPVAALLRDTLADDPSRRPVDGAAVGERLDALLGVRLGPRSDEGTVVALRATGSRSPEILEALVDAGGELGQTIDGDRLVRLEHVEQAFRTVRELVARSPHEAWAIEHGPLVGAGLGLFAGAPASLAARLVRLARPGDVLVGRVARVELGLGLRAALMPVGRVHLAGGEDATVHRLRPEHDCPEARVALADGSFVCVCGAHGKVPLGHVDAVRVSCSVCHEVVTVLASAASGEITFAKDALAERTASPDDDAFLELLGLE